MTLITMQDGKVVLRDGKVGTEQECCCGGCPCSMGDLVASGLTPHVVAAATLPGNAGDCEAGTFTAEFDLEYNQFAFDFYGDSTVDMPNGNSLTFSGLLSCGIYGRPGKYSLSVDGITTCTLGNGAFIGFGQEVEQIPILGTTVIDGNCVPQGGTFTYYNAVVDVTVEYTLTFI